MENFHWKISINSRPLFIMFSHLFGCPKAKESALINVLYLIWSKGRKSLVMRLGPKAPLIKQTQHKKRTKIERYSTIFFYLLFGCSIANFGPLLRGKAYTDTMLITAFIQVLN